MSVRKCTMMSVYSTLSLYRTQCTTSLPYFGVKLSCVCLMFAYRKKSNDL